jgi:hypothetical protein
MRRTHPLNWLWLGLLVALLASCGDQDMTSSRPDATADAVSPDTSITDTTTTPDVSSDVSSDTSLPDTSHDTDDGGLSDTRLDTEVVAPLFGLKADERFIVPGNVASKTWPTMAGPLVAWVESTDAAPVLMVWDTRSPSTAPRAYVVPMLSDPRELALSDAFLAYVDDRYGDPDIFAIDLESGVERPVVTRPGAQEKPAIIGSRVAWEDCRQCLTGVGIPGREVARQVVERDLAGGGERSVSTSAAGAFSPRYGLLEDGRQALVWVEGRTTLVVERLEPGFDRRHDVVASLPANLEVASANLVAGLISWRPRPLIVNPDSMIVNPDSMWPSDLFVSSADTGDTTRVTTHAELGASLPIGIEGLGTTVAWLESPPGDATSGSFRRLDTSVSPLTPDTLFTLAGTSGFALGNGFAVVTAPRADNDGLDDLHLFPIPPLP